MIKPTLRDRVRLTGLALVLVVALAGVGLKVTQAGGEGEGVAFTKGNLVRLHIIANSDTPSDQRVKLLIRDDLLREARQLFQGTLAPAEARATVQSNLPFFQRIAERRLKAEGFAYPVRVEYGVYPFPQRTYGDLTLPAGRYTALRLILGKGAGRNWWCVLFPPLCFLEADHGLARDRVKVSRVAPGDRLAIRVTLRLPAGPQHPVPLSILASPLWK